VKAPDEDRGLAARVLRFIEDAQNIGQPRSPDRTGGLGARARRALLNLSFEVADLLVIVVPAAFILLIILIARWLWRLWGTL